MKKQMKTPTRQHEKQDDIARAAKRVARNWQAWLLIVGITLVLGVWRLMVVAQQPKHLQEIAGEYGSVAEFWDEPMPNPAGTKILFQQSTETGVGVFVADTTNGGRQLLCEQAEKGFDNASFRIWGWTRDGSRFAYGWRPDKESKREIVICDGRSGEKLATVLMDRTVKEFAWLSPNAFVYADDYQELHRAEQLSKTRWGRPEPFLKPALDAKGKPVKRSKLSKEEMAALPAVEGLTAMSPNSVAFLRERTIWTWEFRAPEPTPLWSDTNQTLIDFSVDHASQRLLLRSKGDADEVLARYHWPTKHYYSFKKVPALRLLNNRLVWLSGDGCAYVQRGLMNHIIRIHNSAGAEPIEFKFEGGLNNFAANESGVYAFGSVAGEPVAIWRFAPGAEVPSCVVSNPQASFKYAKPIAPLRETLTNQNGEVTSYRLWAPPHVAPNRQYPLLIGKATQRWQGYSAAVAQGGAYVVSIEQQAEDGEWSEKALPIYEHLRTTLKVNERELYLYGASAATRQLSRLLEEHPGTWRGAILFSPASFPDIKQFRVPRLMIDCGGEDVRADMVTKYRDDAAQAGMAVTVALHENAGHVYKSVASLRERDQAVMKFLFGR
jgi:hypothetical protein